MSGVAILRDGPVAAALAETLAGTAPGPWLEQQRVLKRDRHSLVALAPLDGRHCYLKLYQPKHPVQRLLFRCGGGRAPAAFDHALALRSAGIAVPEPLACVRAGGALVLATEGFAGASDLKQRFVDGAAEPALRALMRQAGETLSSLHRAGFAHGDGKWSNFLIVDEAMLLVDLESVQASERFGAATNRDLARFTLNAEDMGLSPELYGAFLESYTEPMGLRPGDARVRMRPVLQRLRQRHLKKYGPRGHPLV